MAKQQETRFKEKVLKILKTIEGIWFVKVQQVVTRGTPDILICYRGRFVAWELKTETGRLDALQAYNLETINKAGGIGRIVSPSTLNYALEELHGISTTEERAGTEAGANPCTDHNNATTIGSARRGPLR